MADIRTRLADAIFTETTRIVFTSTGEDVEKRVAAIMSMSAQQLADVLLSLPGIAIVELPEGPWKWALGLGDSEDLYARDGLVIISGIDAVSPGYARELASALLAAANAAEAAS